MEKAMAKLGRDNHLNNLISRLPVLTIIYGIQCFVINHFVQDINIGDFAFYLAISLIIFVCALFVHDKYHHVLLYKDHILIYFEPFNMCHKIMYEDIEDIMVPEKECDFSSVLIKLKNKETVSFHFVDYPVQVKQVIHEIMQGRFEEKDLKQAA